MNRWTLPFGRAAWLLAAGVLLAPQAWADRNFPAQVERGSMTFLNQREIKLDGKVERTAPGLVVRNERNVMPLPGSLVGQTHTVHYLRDPLGLVRQVWILTPQEMAKPLPSQSRAARNAQRQGVQADTTDLYRN